MSSLWLYKLRACTRGKTKCTLQDRSYLSGEQHPFAYVRNYTKSFASIRLIVSSLVSISIAENICSHTSAFVSNTNVLLLLLCTRILCNRTNLQNPVLAARYDTDQTPEGARPVCRTMVSRSKLARMPSAVRAERRGMRSGKRNCFIRGDARCSRKAQLCNVNCHSSDTVRIDCVEHHLGPRQANRL